MALLMPLFGRLFDLHRSDAAFVLAALSPVLGYGLWPWANRQQRHFPKQVANPAF